MAEDALQRLIQVLQARGDRIATAESCTAGLAAKLLTDAPGSTAWFERGFITYSNEAKIEMLGVGQQTLDKWGAVSREVVHEMATGALQHSHADVALAISGIAGPGGGCLEKPVGTVWFAWADDAGHCAEVQHFDGDREAVRSAAAAFALAGMLRYLAR